MAKIHLTLLGACLCLAPYGAMAQGAGLRSTRWAAATLGA